MYVGINLDVIENKEKFKSYYNTQLEKIKSLDTDDINEPTSSSSSSSNILEYLLHSNKEEIDINFLLQHSDLILSNGNSGDNGVEIEKLIRDMKDKETRKQKLFNNANA
jgi:hypothetical protein